MKDALKAGLAAGTLGALFFPAPGLALLSGITTAESGGAPNWALALGGVLFTLFGLLLIAVGIATGRGVAWRRMALYGMMAAFPATAALLAWPATNVPLPLPGEGWLHPAAVSEPMVLRVVLGIASAAFAWASVILWWLVLSGRAGPKNVRGMSED